MSVLVLTALTHRTVADERETECGRWFDRKRGFGIIVLGTLMGGVPVLALADGRTIATPPTATSRLVLLAPTLTLTVTTASDSVNPGDGKLSLREAVTRANA